MNICGTCGGDLSITTMNDGLVGTCGCGSVWLSRGIATMLLRGGLIEPTRGQLRTLFARGSHAPKAQADGYRTGYRTTARECIECREPLKLVVTDPAKHGVRMELDMCEEHGIWFDPGEAWRLTQAMELLELDRTLNRSKYGV